VVWQRWIWIDDLVSELMVLTVSAVSQYHPPEMFPKLYYLASTTLMLFYPLGE